MAEEEGYQGWTNYETWAVMQEIGMQEHYERITMDVLKECDEDTQINEVAEVLRDTIDEGAPTLEANMYRDLLTCAIGRVDYDELAKALISNVKETDEYKVMMEDRAEGVNM